ncbi:MAG: hypothetical protein FJ304_25690 [Planctomycetes bacterium]|nr:hypothetical protein [Planctomycetota bacterium]
MNPALRHEILALIADALRLSPDVRVGQLFALLGDLGHIDSGRALGDLDDVELLSVVRQHLADLAGRAHAVA